MKPLYDYFYNVPAGQLRKRGRCRVRIYEQKNNARTVVLTELFSNTGDSITEACARIATNLAAIRGLNVKTTRWIQHEPPHDEEPHVFEEIRFTWDSDVVASDPQWEPINDAQAESLTGDTPDSLNRRFGDQVDQVEKEGEGEPTEAERTS